LRNVVTQARAYIGGLHNIPDDVLNREFKVPIHSEEEDVPGTNSKRPTGNKILSFKTKAVWRNGKAKTIPLYDAALKPLQIGGGEISGGSKVCVRFSVHPFYLRRAAASSESAQYFFGVTFYLIAVQVLEAKVSEAKQDQEGFYGFDRVQSQTPETGTPPWEGSSDNNKMPF